MLVDSLSDRHIVRVFDKDQQHVITTFFRGLKDLKAKDAIQFSTPNGKFNYEVESVKIVEADNVGVLAPSGEYSLTMVTCYPFSYVGPASKRFVVTARQVSPQVRSLATVPAGGKRSTSRIPLAL